MVRASVAAKERRRLRKDVGGFDSVQASGQVSFADDCIVTRCSLHSADGGDGNIAGLSTVGNTVYKYPTLKETGSIPIVAKTKSSRVVVGARLLHVVDNYLRRKQRGRGDMSALIYQALREVDLGSVQLITIQGQRHQVTARPTKIVLPTDVRDQLERWSEARACSMNELLNSALVVSLLKRSEKTGERSRRGQTPTFDTMTAQEREGFFAGLLALTGQEPGPDPRSREGNYYEWNRKLDATVEVAGDGRRYLMERVGPGEMVRARELKGSAFVERPTPGPARHP